MAVGLAALIITVVALVRWSRTEGENVHRLNFVPGFSLQKLAVTHFDTFCLFREQNTDGRKRCEFTSCTLYTSC